MLLHGWPQHWYAWRKIIPVLAEHHRVISPDLRGFGWTAVRRRGGRDSRSPRKCQSTQGA